MKDKKKIGAYYTPKLLSDFMVKYVLNEYSNDSLNILEPSVGDGIFIESLNDEIKNKDFIRTQITIIDIEREELKKAKESIDKNAFDGFLSYHKDFLEFNTNKSYSLIIGNPPYIKKKLLSDTQKRIAKLIHKKNGLSKNEINNIWTAFVIKSISLLQDDGILAFVLPADILQVKYAKEIRGIFEEKFEKTDIFIVDNNIYSEIDQRLVLVFGFKKHQKKGVFFYRFNDINENKYEKISSNGLMISNLKWNHYLLSSSEIELLNSFYQKLPKLESIISSKTGIVTGANNYFIINRETLKEYDLSNFAIPIIQKGSFVNGRIIFDEKDFKNLLSENKPVYLLKFDKTNLQKINNQTKKYLSIGENLKIDKRYKCSKRDIWYCIPNIKNESPKLFFFKRSHIVPKLLINKSNSYVTDAAYEIYLKDKKELYNFTYSFYNLITLIYTELTGRKYGGGVLELTPKEFRSLPVFLFGIVKNDFNKFESEFTRSNNKILTILKKSEKDLLERKLIDDDTFDKLVKIYSKLLGERLNTGANIVYKQWRENC